MTDKPSTMHIDVEEELAKLGVPTPVEIEAPTPVADDDAAVRDHLRRTGFPVDEIEAVHNTIATAPTLVEWKEGPNVTKIPGSAVDDWREEYSSRTADVAAVTKATGNPKDAVGDTKPDISLVPAAGILLEAQAMMDGARKYGPYNWRENPVRMRVYIAAAMRHLQQLLDGEDIDPLSDVYHIGHARACLGILADATFTGNLIDDRPLPGSAGTMIRRFGDTKSFKPE